MAGLSKVLPTSRGSHKLPAQTSITNSYSNQDYKSTHWLNKITQFTVNLNCFGFLLATPARENKFFVASAATELDKT